LDVVVNAASWYCEDGKSQTVAEEQNRLDENVAAVISNCNDEQTVSKAHWRLLVAVNPTD
jgi:hypothetical protein